MNESKDMRQVSLGRYFTGVKPPVQLDCPARISISSIPPELLTDIFLYLHILSQETQYQDLPPQDPDGPLNTRAPRPWNYLEITRVSKYWRSLVLSSKLFWTRIPLLNAHWTAAAPEIASPLSLYIHVDFNIVGEIVDRFLDSLVHLPRVRQLVFTTTHENYYLFPYLYFRRVTGPLLCRPAPLLEEFVLSTGGGCTVPQNIFAADGLPSLRRLELEYCRIRYSCPLFATTLTSLELVSVFDVWADTEEFMQSLSRMPRLETLRLERKETLPDDLESVNTKDMDKLSLDHLQSLTLHADLIRLSAFLELVKFPVNACLILEAECSVLTPVDGYARLPAAIASHFASVAPASASYASLALRSTSSIACLTCMHPIVPGTLPDHVDVDIAWHEEADIDSVEALLEQIVGALPVKQLAILSVVAADLAAEVQSNGTTTTVYTLLARSLARRVLMRGPGVFALAVTRCVVTREMIRGLGRVLSKERVVWDRKFGIGKTDEGVQKRLYDYTAFRSRWY
ncbi:hypothetical protein OF83DRAFT_1142968 [Amylostereum chailletii]|nr:hypothetical protein OF83DRAFT_1142968 [Amylostereum chailletii]